MWCLQLALCAIRSAILSTHFIDLHYNQLPSVQMQCYHSKSERKQGGRNNRFNNFYHEYKEKINSKTLNANCNNRTQYYRQVWKLKKTIKTVNGRFRPRWATTESKQHTWWPVWQIRWKCSEVHATSSQPTSRAMAHYMKIWRHLQTRKLIVTLSLCLSLGYHWLNLSLG